MNFYFLLSNFSKMFSILIALILATGCQSEMISNYINNHSSLFPIDKKTTTKAENLNTFDHLSRQYVYNGGNSPDGGNEAFFNGIGFPSTADGIIVGAVRVELPMVEEFNIRFTMPVPQGTALNWPDKTEFAIEDYDGRFVLAQTESVSLYGNDEPNVVELIALVHRDPNSQPGQMATYLVKKIPEIDLPENNINLLKSAINTIRQDSTVKFQTTDVFGHVYEYAIGNLNETPKKVWASGPYINRVEVAGIMKNLNAPEGPPNGALENMHGIKVLLTAQVDRPYSLKVDVRIHNGLTDKSNTDLYYKDITVLIPNDSASYSLTPKIKDPYWQDTQLTGDHTLTKIVKPHGGGLHYFPERRQIVRSMILTQLGNTSEARAWFNLDGLGVIRDGYNDNNQRYYSWQSIPGIFSAGGVLPTLPNNAPLNSLCQDQASDFEHYKQWMENGWGSPDVGNSQYDYYFLAPVMGAFHIHAFDKNGSATGGEEVLPHEGIGTATEGCKAWFYMADLKHHARIGRQNYWAKRDGTLPRVDEIKVVDETGLITHETTGYLTHVGVSAKTELMNIDKPNHPFNFKDAPTFQADYVDANSLIPDYKDLLDSFKPADFQHMIRDFYYLPMLIILTNNPLYKDSLDMLSNKFEFYFNEHPIHVNSANSAYVLNDGSSALSYSTLTPNNGRRFARGFWGGYALNEAHRFATHDTTWRRSNLDWYSFVNKLLDLTIMCSGFFQRINPPHQQPVIGFETMAFAQFYEHTFIRLFARSAYEVHFRGSGLEDEISKMSDNIASLSYAYLSPVTINPATGEQTDKFVVALDEDSPPICSQHIGSNPGWPNRYHTVGFVDAGIHLDDQAFWDQILIEKGLVPGDECLILLPHMLSKWVNSSDLDSLQIDSRALGMLQAHCGS